MSLDTGNLAQQWIRAQLAEDRDSSREDFDATDIVLHLPYESTELAWEFVEEVLRRTSSKEVLALLAAGTLEELIAVDSSCAIAKLTELVSRYPVVRELLNTTWQNATPEHVWQEVLKLRRG